MTATGAYAVIRVGADGRRGAVGSYRRAESADRAARALARSAGPGIRYEVVALDVRDAEAVEDAVAVD